MRYQFEDVTIDTERLVVTVKGKTVHLSPRAFATLRALAEHAGRPISRTDLMRAVWPDTHVVPNSVSQAVLAVRRVLADSRGAECIQAIPRQGYMLAAIVRPLPDDRIPCDDVSAGPAQRGSLPRWWRIAVVCIISTSVILLQTNNGTAPWSPHPESLTLSEAASTRLRSRRGPDLRAAVALFSEAAQKDPLNAAAYAGLAEAHYLVGFYGVEDRRVASSLAKSAASRAIALDRRQARAYVVRASVMLDMDWDLSASAADFRRALEIEPGDSLIQQWSAWWCMAANRMADARAAVDRAVSLNPFSPAAITARATFAYLDGDYDAAITDSRRALQIDPEFFRAYLRLGLTLLAQHKTTEAVEHLDMAHRLAPDIPETASALAHAYAIAGRRSDAARLFEESRERLPFYDRAIVLTALAQPEEAAMALRRARDHGELDAGLLAGEPRLAPLRSEPEIQVLLSALPSAQIHLPRRELLRPPDRVGR